ncbi:hypothetical protein N9772_00055 [Bacteroidia bacterium]|nr:hypothetical protein [Bacteroidia bacterium]
MKNTLSVEHIFDRNRDWLFAFTQDFAERKKWDKQTKSMKFLNGFSTLEKGAQVYTESIEGIRMDTEYLSFDAPNKISIRMLNRSSLFSLFIGTWHYIQLAEDRTSLKITYQFSLRFPFILIKKLVSRRIKANITKKLTDLEIHLSKLTS